MDRGADFRDYRLPADDVSGGDCRLDLSVPETPSVAGFAIGTRIKTLFGEIRAENLRRGDRVLTRDNGYQSVRWIDRISGHTTGAPPVRLRKGVLGRGVPDRGLLVGPQQHLLIGSDRFPDGSAPPEVLIMARDLTCLVGISCQKHQSDALVQVLFDRHELIIANGAWCPSFPPTRAALAALSPMDSPGLAKRLSEMNKEIGDYTCARPEPVNADIRKTLIQIRDACPTGANDAQVTRDRT